jgi:hypothetical protein
MYGGLLKIISAHYKRKVSRKISRSGNPTYFSRLHTFVYSPNKEAEAVFVKQEIDEEGTEGLAVV